MEVKDYNKTLTNRELEVLELLALGFSNDVIAEKLFVSTHTVKAHLESIYRKLNVCNKVQASVIAVTTGLIVIRPEDISNNKF